MGENNDRVSVVQCTAEMQRSISSEHIHHQRGYCDSVRGLRHEEADLNTGQPSSTSGQCLYKPLGVGACKEFDIRELQKISYDPSLALLVPEFTDLPAQEQLSAMSTVVVRATPMTPTVTVEKKPMGRDVVFLLDGSDGTRSGFPAMRDFVQRVVETLSVDDNKDQGSVVQQQRSSPVLSEHVHDKRRDPRHCQRFEAQRRKTAQYWSSSPVLEGQCLHGLCRKQALGRSSTVSNSSSSPPRRLWSLITPESPTVLVDCQKDNDSSGWFERSQMASPAMRDFVERVVEKLNVEKTTTAGLCGPVTGRDAEVHFYLNTYTTREDVDLSEG
ncbi:collagen alpha-3(VI) chain [Lates japonicus]|uniref:Collagen alpha-3(VI) chain n=1 Tax=Lates japonicus TaxID=270547 RepID=A0AAD3MBF6_LATJO|nr:collagen alpha-3(VI) chain [Lates japonicus]